MKVVRLPPGYTALRLKAGQPGSRRCLCSRSRERIVGHDAAFVVGNLAESASDTLVCLMIRLRPSVRAFVMSSLSAPGMAGHLSRPCRRARR